MTEPDPRNGDGPASETRFESVRELFLAARDLSTTDRVRFLDEACGERPSLRAEIESLLEQDDPDASFLETPALGRGFRVDGIAEGADPAPCSSRPDQTSLHVRGVAAKAGVAANASSSSRLGENPPGRIGPYKILQPIGEGGFGAVYMAEQIEPVRRRVAVKLIKPGMDSRQVIARFEAERQALAMMEHPHIAQVYDAGTTADGRPFFVMELVRGVPITEFCRTHSLETTERLRIFRSVCDAVQHAHLKGVIHRDLKPSNVLVTWHDGPAVPKVIDFGIAKATSGRLTDRTLFTEFRQLIGTPEYMSPEQAEFSGLDVDTRTDVYALGVLLYELLTGTTPLDGASLRRAAWDEMLRLIREVDPPRPSVRLSSLNEVDDAKAKSESNACSEANRRARRRSSTARPRPRVGDDLDWIVMKALEKDRTRRYATAREMSQDIQRYLDDEPVTAVAPGPWYRTRRFLRRHRVATLVIAALLISLLGGLGIALAGLAEARRGWSQARLAESRQRDDAERLRIALEAARRAQAEADAQADRTAHLMYAGMLGMADEAVQAGRIPRARELLEACPERLRDWEWRWVARSCRDQARILPALGDASPTRMAWHPDGRRLGVGYVDGHVRIWDVRDGRVLHHVELLDRAVTALALSNDGRWMVVGDAGGQLACLDVATGELLGSIPIAHAGPVRALQTLDEAKAVLSIGEDGELQLWLLPGFEPNNEPLQSTLRGLTGVGFSPRGEKIATAGDDGRLVVWTRNRGSVRIALEIQTIAGPYQTLSWDPTGNRLATASWSGTLSLWDPRSGVRLGILRRQAEPIEAIAFRPDARMLAAGGRLGVIRLFDARTGEPIATQGGEQGAIRALKFSPAGEQLAVIGDDGTVRIWDAEQLTGRVGYLGHRERVVRGLVARDGRRLISLDRRGDLRLWDVLTGAPGDRFATDLRTALDLEVSDDGRVAAVLGESVEGAVRVQIWDLDDGRLRDSWAVDGACRALGLSPDGRLLVAGSPLNRSQSVTTEGSPSRVVALSCYDLETDNTSAQIDWTVAGPEVSAVAWGGSTTTAITATSRGQVALWDLASEVSEASQRRYWRTDSESTVSALGYDPRGLILVGDIDGRVWVWSIETGDLQRMLPAHGSAIAAIRVVEGAGRWLTAARDGGEIRFWDAITGDLLLSRDSRIPGLSDLRVLPEDSGLLLVGGDGALMLWELATPPGLALARRAAFEEAQRRLQDDLVREALSGS